MFTGGVSIVSMARSFGRRVGLQALWARGWWGCVRTYIRTYGRTGVWEHHQHDKGDRSAVQCAIDRPTHHHHHKTTKHVKTHIHTCTIVSSSPSSSAAAPFLRRALPGALLIPP